MKTILEELFDGNIYPAELIISQNPDYYLLNKEISCTLEMWKSKLSDHSFNELENLMDLRCRSDSLHSEASFMYGFKLGAMIMIEVFTGKDELVRNRE